ncbi:MAG TPA: ABC transporter substrate-binding protein [Pseudolabrys sp.]|jgi:NitT/TauT family transport system substrate-binding protein|nr:ABC transporter substrate-binding protein [Pseudolabrys sp.]
MAAISRRFFLAGAAGALAMPSLARGQNAAHPVRFAVDWVWQGNHSIWTYAQDSGIFAGENIAPQLMRGYGSADNLTKLAGGALDMALVDPNLLAKFNHDNPNAQAIDTCIVYDAAPTSIIFLKSSGIKTLKDLEGKRLAVSQGDASWPLFQVLCKLKGVDISKISIQNMSGQLRDSMVVQKRVDASLGFYVTAVLNIAAAGVPREDIGYLQFNKMGLALYSLSLVCLKDYAKKNPDAVRGFVHGTVKGVKAMLANKPAAIRSLLKRDNLLNFEVESARNDLIINGSLLTPWVKENGLSTVDPKRFEYTTGIVAQAFGLKTKPKMDDIYTPKFLPPQSERMLT